MIHELKNNDRIVQIKYIVTGRVHFIQYITSIYIEL